MPLICVEWDQNLESKPLQTKTKLNQRTSKKQPNHANSSIYAMVAAKREIPRNHAGKKPGSPNQPLKLSRSFEPPITDSFSRGQTNWADTPT